MDYSVTPRVYSPAPLPVSNVTLTGGGRGFFSLRTQLSDFVSIAVASEVDDEDPDVVVSLSTLGEAGLCEAGTAASSSNVLNLCAGPGQLVYATVAGQGYQVVSSLSMKKK